MLGRVEENLCRHGTESKSREADALGRAVESIKFAGEHKLGRVRGGKMEG